MTAPATIATEVPSPILSETEESESAQGLLKSGAEDAADGEITDTDSDGILDSVDVSASPSAELNALTKSRTASVAADIATTTPEPDEKTKYDYTGAPKDEPPAPTVVAARPQLTSDGKGITSFTLNGDRTIKPNKGGYDYVHSSTTRTSGSRNGGGGSSSSTKPLNASPDDFKNDVHSFLAGNVSNWDEMSPTKQDSLIKYVDKKYNKGGTWDEKQAEAAFKGISDEIGSGRIKDGEDTLYHARPTRDAAGGTPYLDEISDIDRLESRFKNQDSAKLAQARRHYETLRADLEPTERSNFVENIGTLDEVIALGTQDDVARGRTSSGKEILPTHVEKQEQAAASFSNGKALQTKADEALETARKAVDEALKLDDNQQILVLDRALKEVDAVAADYDRQIGEVEKSRTTAITKARDEARAKATTTDPDSAATQAEAEATQEINAQISKLTKEKEALLKNAEGMKIARDTLDEKTGFSAKRTKYDTVKKANEALLEAMRHGDVKGTNEHYKAVTGEDAGLTKDNLTTEGKAARTADLDADAALAKAEAAAGKAESDEKRTKLKEDLAFGTDVAEAAIEYGNQAKAVLTLAEGVQGSIDTLTRREETKERMDAINTKLMEFMSETLSAITAVTSTTIAEGFTTLREAANPEKPEQTATQKAAHDRAYDAEARTAQLEARTARMSVSDDIETKEAEVEKTEAERDKLKAEAQAKWYKENPKYG